jgi:hypothetical protein
MHLPRDELRPACFEMYACQCYHHKFVNPAAMTVYMDYMNEVATDIEKNVDYPTVCTHSTIEHSDPLVATEGELNPHSIDFEADEGDLNERAAFEDLPFSEELDLRMMDATGDMDEMRERLRKRLKREKGLVDIIDLITHSFKNLQALVPTITSIPCILHSEIRIAIKILTRIFSTGIDGHETKTDQFEFSDELVEIVNTEILGSANNPSQWIVPISDKRNSEPSESGRVKIGDLLLQGPQVRKLMGKIDVVIKKCIPEEKKNQTLFAVKHYFKAKEILSQHHDYSMADIVMFQAKVEQFMREWVALYGLEGISNYTHMFTSGHDKWFMEEYGNLHHFSQQGFESMNDLVTSFLKKRTQRGGFTSQTNPMPIARWIQRRLIWLC